MQKALLVGLNKYSNPTFNLRGCENDISSLKNLLTENFGFDSLNINVLIDSQGTKQRILEALNNLIQSSTDGDNIVFAFSGHGTQKNSNDPLEPDTKDEALVSYNSVYNDLITDNELYSIIGQRGDAFLESINFTAIYDCCHSGTMIRNFSFDPITGEIIYNEMNRCIYISDLMENPVLNLRQVQLGPYNVFSACLDNETAADLKVDGEFRGAFSYALHKVIRQNTNVNIGDLDANVLPIIQTISRHVQNPNYYAIDNNRRVFNNGLNP